MSMLKASVLLLIVSGAFGSKCEEHLTCSSCTFELECEFQYVDFDSGFCYNSSELIHGNKHQDHIPITFELHCYERHSSSTQSSGDAESPISELENTKPSTERTNNFTDAEIHSEPIMEMDNYEIYGLFKVGEKTNATLLWILTTTVLSLIVLSTYLLWKCKTNFSEFDIGTVAESSNATDGGISRRYCETSV